MAVQIDFKLLGDKKLARKFRRLEDKMQKKIARKAMRAGAKPLLKDMKTAAAAITNPRNSTETMKEVGKRLKLRAIKRSRVRMGVQIVTPTREELDVVKGNHYPPAHIELGTSDTAPQPFMRGPLKAGRERSLGIIRRELWNGIRQEARRGG
jgi:HK97 gp10 family phage protein